MTNNVNGSASPTTPVRTPVRDVRDLAGFHPGMTADERCDLMRAYITGNRSMPARSVSVGDVVDVNRDSAIVLTVRRSPDDTRVWWNIETLDGHTYVWTSLASRLVTVEHPFYVADDDDIASDDSDRW